MVYPIVTIGKIVIFRCCVSILYFCFLLSTPPLPFTPLTLDSLAPPSTPPNPPAYFTVFTGGQIFGLTITEYMNHVFNQILHVYAVLYCDSIRRYIIKSGIGLIMKDATFFCVAYYCWIWQCYFSLGKWPYDFLDLRVGLGNKIFFAVAAGCYAVVYCNFKVCVWVEKKVNEAAEKKETETVKNAGGEEKRASTPTRSRSKSKSRSRSKSRSK